MVTKRFLRVFEILLVMVVGLMALGAGVRAMNAGLSCPDWPLCFGKVIPDFHVGVYFEFIHRAYAGLVALLFTGCLVYLLRNKAVPRKVKVLGGLAAGVLSLQVLMGGLTVLHLLQAWTVASHLMLATSFFSLLLWMRFELSPEVKGEVNGRMPLFKSAATIMPALVLGQILLGGMVASTYSGLVCVDFPLCNGQWVPTIKGPIGLQVLHRFGAYTVTAFVIWIFMSLRIGRKPGAVNAQLLEQSRLLLSVVLLQVSVGVANVIFYLPAWLTVLHQALAITLLAVSLRLAFTVRWRQTAAVVAEDEAPQPRLRLVRPSQRFRRA